MFFKHRLTCRLLLLQLCSLLFKALSSEPDGDGCAAVLPVLARYSDTEEDVEDDLTRSPTL